MLDDFVVPAGTRWHITGLFTNNVTGYPFAVAPFTQAVWSIRTGVSPTSFGTVLYGGTSAVTIVPTGRIFVFGTYTEYTVTVSGLSIDLDAGHYYFTVSPLTQSTTLYSVGDGSSANAVGPGGPEGMYQEYEQASPPEHRIAVSSYPRGSMGVIGTASATAPAAAPALSPLGYALLAAALAIAGLLVMRR